MRFSDARESRTCPGEVDPCIAPPTIAEGLGDVEHLQPAEGHQVFPGGFDAPQVHAKNVGNPGRLAPASTAAVMLPVVETAEHVAQHGGDDRGFEPARDEAYSLSRYWYATAVVGNDAVHRKEAGEIRDASEVRWRGGEGERGVRPGEQAVGVEPAEGRPVMRSPTNKSVEFAGRVGGDLVRCELTASGDHLVGREPDTQILELDQPGAVGPPDQAELLDGEKNKPPCGLSSRAFRICSCHVTSL